MTDHRYCLTKRHTGSGQAYHQLEADLSPVSASLQHQPSQSVDFSAASVPHRPSHFYTNQSTSSVQPTDKPGKQVIYFQSANTTDVQNALCLTVYADSRVRRYCSLLINDKRFVVAQFLRDFILLHDTVGKNSGCYIFTRNEISCIVNYLATV